MTKILIWASKIFLGLMALLLLATWVRWFVDTPALLEQYELQASSTIALNALKTSMGGAILVIAVFIVLYFIKGRKWLYPIAISSGALLVSRLISVFQVGHTTMIWVGVVFEILIILAALYLHSNSENQNVKTTNK